MSAKLTLQDVFIVKNKKDFNAYKIMTRPHILAQENVSNRTQQQLMIKNIAIKVLKTQKRVKTVKFKMVGYANYQRMGCLNVNQIVGIQVKLDLNLTILNIAIQEIRILTGAKTAKLWIHGLANKMNQRKNMNVK